VKKRVYIIIRLLLNYIKN